MNLPNCAPGDIVPEPHRSVQGGSGNDRAPQAGVGTRHLCTVVQLLQGQKGRLLLLHNIDIHLSCAHDPRLDLGYTLQGSADVKINSDIAKVHVIEQCHSFDHMGFAQICSPHEILCKYWDEDMLTAGE